MRQLDIVIPYDRIPDINCILYNPTIAKTKINRFGIWSVE